MKLKIFVCLFLFFASIQVQAVYKITLKDWFDHYYFYPSNYINLYSDFTKYFWKWKEIVLSTDEIDEISKYDKIEKRIVKWIDRSILKRFIEEMIIPKANRDWTWATLYVNPQWRVIFSNKVFTDKKIDLDLTVFLLEKAIKENVDEIELPVIEKTPEIEYDESLTTIWVNSFISSVRSDYSDSSRFRLINIRTAVSKFNWLVIQPWEIFSFVKYLWNVNPQSGFVRELVIKSTSVAKEYWWWVCQVSTTIFRSALMTWLPIKQRRNHSFRVNHYEPQWTDATIYIWVQDLKFQNNFKHPIVLQWIMNGDHLYFNVYWNKDDRIPFVEFYWPYFSNEIYMPPDIYSPTSALWKWKKMLLLRWQRWIDATVFRVNDWIAEKIYSRYKAVPNRWKIWM